MNRTGFVWHERYMWHNTGDSFGPIHGKKYLEPVRHLENVEGKRRIKNLMDLSGLTGQLHLVQPRAATRDEILAVHDAEHIDRIKLISDNHGGETSSRLSSTHIGPGGFEIAVLSAGGVISAVDAVLSGRVTNAYALVRPPGHHAEINEARGFCIFSNACIAARFALNHPSVNRVAFVDIDVHHGNGAQQIFWDDPDVLTISIHQDRAYPPDSGFIEENGAGAGEGFNINIPLPPGTGTGAYQSAFKRIILPALKAYVPDLIIVPTGFDAGAHDPLGRMLLHSAAYRELTSMLMGVADEVCDGRLVMCHEGGYSAHSVPFFCLAVLETLSGLETEVEDPFLPAMQSMSYQELQTHQEAVIRNVEPLVDKLITRCSDK